MLSVETTILILQCKRLNNILKIITLIYKKIISDQIYQCISNKTYSLDEMQVGLHLGAAASAKGNIHFRIRDVMEHLEFSFD